MKNVLIINGHHPYPFSEGALNGSIVEKTREHLSNKGYDVRTTKVTEGYDIEAEVENHVWADAVILQFPVNWMGVPWSFKKYMDEVYTAGLDGRLCTSDGRHSDNPKVGYGTGGNLQGKKQMLSVTYNAPAEAFHNPDEPFMAGKGIDDMLFPYHLNAKFLGMDVLPTFAVYDVMKNPTVEEDFKRLQSHLDSIFGLADQDKDHNAA